MSILERVKDPLKGPKVPKDIDEKRKRGREVMLKDAAQRRLCLRFWRGDQYWYVNEKGLLLSQDTVTHVRGGGKPPHRIRNRYNFIGLMVEGKVSAATQRVPGYEVYPSTTDPEDYDAADLAEKVATYGYDQWRLRRATEKVVTLAVVCDEGFAMPVFDPNVGPYRTMEKRDPQTGELVLKDGVPEVEVVGEGEIKIRTFSGNEVYWESGCDFDQSPWHCVEQARPKSEVEQLPGYFGGSLVPDATTSEIPTDRYSTSDDQMVLVTEYFERPCPKYPKGRKLTIANDREILPREDYPSKGPDGRVSDELCLHRLSYIVDPDSDRDRGLVEQLIDLQRTVNDCWNKALEWKNRTLNPQMIAPKGSNMPRRTDEPGAVWQYNVVSGQKPEWEKPLDIPGGLLQLRDDAIQQMRMLAADTEVQAEADLAAKTVQAVVEQDQRRWQHFLANLAEFHSRLMRHCLTLVQVHYSEPRKLQLRGRYGTDPYDGFMGSQLRGQIDVRVQPGSIEAKSREAVRRELEFLTQAYPGAISPEAAQAALNGGQGRKLLESYNLDVARAHKMIQRLQQGPQAMLTFLPRVEPKLGIEVPGWMPREQDNAAVHRQVFADFMKTDAYDRLPPETQEMFNLYWGGIEWIERERAIARAQQEMQIASGLGMANAAQPQSGVQMPDTQGMTSQSATAPQGA